MINQTENKKHWNKKGSDVKERTGGDFQNYLKKKKKKKAYEPTHKIQCMCVNIYIYIYTPIRINYCDRKKRKETWLMIISDLTLLPSYFSPSKY